MRSFLQNKPEKKDIGAEKNTISNDCKWLESQINDHLPRRGTRPRWNSTQPTSQL